MCIAIYNGLLGDADSYFISERGTQKIREPEQKKCGRCLAAPRSYNNNK